MGSYDSPGFQGAVHARPFLKWAGGKGQLIGNFRTLYPEQLRHGSIKYYHEPFLGSGAVFMNIAQSFEIEKAYLSDINEDLVLTYLVVQRNVEKLIEVLNHLQETYARLDRPEREDFYYRQRSIFNLARTTTDKESFSEGRIERAAQFIFLNRTCFNGLYRVNSKGEFNTPVGDYENPAICDSANLRAASGVLSIAEIKRATYTSVEDEAVPGSFVYFDPPYRPISKTSSFKAYNASEFADAQQVQLAATFRKLDAAGVLLMLSNSDPKNENSADNFFDDLYCNYNITRIPARRLINSDATKRGAINEIVVTNYSACA